MMSARMRGRVERHFAAVAAAGFFTVGYGGATAHAAIVYSGAVSINVPSTTSGVYLNVVTGVSSPVRTQVSGWDVNPWHATQLNMFSDPGGISTYIGSSFGYYNLAAGEHISAALGFANTASVINDPWHP